MDAKKPKSENRRRKKLCPVRMTENEHDLLTFLASEAGLSRAAYIRMKALGEVGERSQRLAKPHQKDMARIMGQVGKIGGNLTQLNALVKQANIHGLDPVLAQSLLDEMEQIKEPISDMRAAWLEAIGREH